MGSWSSDPAVQAYVEERLQRGIYKGIGEFHLSATQADAPTVRCCAGWNDLVPGMQRVRSWLHQLPREVTELIAYRNAERLFGKP